MSAREYDGTPMTRREALIARDAFVDACRICINEVPQWEWQAKETAKARYPFPSAKRPRVVEATDASGVAFQFRAIDGRIEWANVGRDDWSEYGPIPVHEQRASFLEFFAKLLKHPTEECEG